MQDCPASKRFHGLLLLLHALKPGQLPLTTFPYAGRHLCHQITAAEAISHVPQMPVQLPAQDGQAFCQ